MKNFRNKSTDRNSTSQCYNIFLEIKIAYNCTFGRELVLFKNKEILIENQTSFINNGIRKESSLSPPRGHWTGI